MNIVINGKNLQKRIINGQEVEKVIRNGVQIRPESTPPTPTNDWLCFTAVTSGTYVYLRKSGSPEVVQLEISYDGNSRSDYTIGSGIRLANAGDSVYMRNKSETVTGFSYGTGVNYYFTFGYDEIYVSGDINYLLCKNSTIDISNTIDSTFIQLFSGCKLLSTPKLTATTLVPCCYQNMFSRTTITTAPTLPATTLADGCYQNMFNGCASLTVAPTLPATQGVSGCYYGMFDGCSSLATLPEINLSSLSSSSCSTMFQNCTNIKISETQTGEYTNTYFIPNGVANSVRDMFKNTGGTFTGTPNLNTTYYTSNTVV